MQIGVTTLVSCDFQELTKDWFEFWGFLCNNSKPKRTSVGLFPSSNSCTFFFCNKRKKQIYKQWNKKSDSGESAEWLGNEAESVNRRAGPCPGAAPLLLLLGSAAGSRHSHASLLAAIPGSCAPSGKDAAITLPYLSQGQVCRARNVSLARCSSPRWMEIIKLPPSQHNDTDAAWSGWWFFQGGIQTGSLLENQGHCSINLLLKDLGEGFIFNDNFPAFSNPNHSVIRRWDFLQQDTWESW